jgi:hypothetical protein
MRWTPSVGQESGRPKRESHRVSRSEGMSEGPPHSAPDASFHPRIVRFPTSVFDAKTAAGQRLLSRNSCHLVTRTRGGHH